MRGKCVLEKYCLLLVNQNKILNFNLYYEGANDGRCLNFGNLNSPPEQESRSMASSCRMSAVHASITVPSPSKKKSFSKMDIPSLRASLFLTDLD